MNYTAEKYLDAIRILATKPGDIRSRLRAAAVPVLRAPINSLPTDLGREAEEIIASLSAKKPRSAFEERVSPVSLTLHGMRDKRATEIAERIFDLYFKIRHLER